MKALINVVNTHAPNCKITYEGIIAQVFTLQNQLNGNALIT